MKIYSKVPTLVRQAPLLEGVPHTVCARLKPFFIKGRRKYLMMLSALRVKGHFLLTYLLLMEINRDCFSIVDSHKLVFRRQLGPVRHGKAWGGE